MEQYDWESSASGHGGRCRVCWSTVGGGCCVQLLATLPTICTLHVFSPEAAVAAAVAVAAAEAAATDAAVEAEAIPLSGGVGVYPCTLIGLVET